MKRFVYISCKYIDIKLNHFCIPKILDIHSMLRIPDIEKICNLNEFIISCHNYELQKVHTYNEL